MIVEFPKPEDNREVAKMRATMRGWTSTLDDNIFAYEPTDEFEFNDDHVYVSLNTPYALQEFELRTKYKNGKRYKHNV